MQMTNEEIVRDYTQAANKSKQIKVLAELNAVSPGEIRAVLAAAGVEGVAPPKRIRQQKPETPARAAEYAPAAGLPPFWERMETILGALPEELPPEAEAIVQNLLQTLFADYLCNRLGREARDEA